MNGKGDKARPLSIDKQEYDRRWARVFDDIMHTEPETCTPGLDECTQSEELQNG